MKKTGFVSLLLSITILAVGCGKQDQNALYPKSSILHYCDTTTQHIFSGKELPKSLVVEQIGDSYSVDVIEDSFLIEETMNAIRAIHVLGSIEEDTQDSSITYIFQMADGSQGMISFWNNDLETATGTYDTSATEALTLVASKILSDEILEASVQ